jgi:hypothetical protein
MRWSVSETDAGRLRLERPMLPMCEAMSVAGASFELIFRWRLDFRIEFEGGTQG